MQKVMSSANNDTSKASAAEELPPPKRTKTCHLGQNGDKTTKEQLKNDMVAPESDDDLFDPNIDDEDELRQLREAMNLQDADYALCCRRCHCNEYDKSRTTAFYLYGDCGNSGQGGKLGNNKLFHRGCCHKEKGGFQTEDYLSPVQMAIEESMENLGNPQEMNLPKPLSHIHSKYKEATKQERIWFNKSDDAAPDSQILSSREYEKHLKDFIKRKPLKSVKVLDLFSGIGAGIIILKRLKIPIETVVHVEHDPVANFVNWYNHENRQDGINHIYIEDYDDINGNKEIRALIDKHGPFDIIFAGPPCCDFSGLNAYRKGIDGESGRYLQDCGRLIGMIDEIQKEEKGVENSVIFLAENVVFYEKDFREDIDDSFGIDDPLPPLQVDSQYFGPCRRSRFYWINVPIEKNFEKATLQSQYASVKHIFTENHIMPEEVVAHENDLAALKANTFLAATSRIDDYRMMKLQEVPPGSGEYVSLRFSVTEREQMMGLPVGYVESAMNELYDTLTMKGFFEPEQNTDGTSWRRILPKKFHIFSSKCKFKFKPSGTLPYFKLLISAQPNRKPKNDEEYLEGIKNSFYDKEGYCKRLIGNGWSIPTVEWILKALASEQFCSETQDYEGYDYQFPWPPHGEAVEAEEIIDI